MLEVIDRGHCTKSHPTPLLFVHGAYHAAWCWDEYFLDFFGDRGFHAVAVSLRGHGASPISQSLRLCSVGDYVQDVLAVAGGLTTAPILLGHSLGGFVVQKCLETRDAPAAVLLASVPPRGHNAAAQRLLRRNPWLGIQSLIRGKPSLICNTPTLVRSAFFSECTPDSVVASVTARIGEESQRALTIDATFLDLVRPTRVRTPVLVLGAEADAIYTRQEVERTARAYGSEAEMFPRIGHDMMLDTGWETVAQRIYEWLTERGH